MSSADCIVDERRSGVSRGRSGARFPPFPRVAAAACGGGGTHAPSELLLPTSAETSPPCSADVAAPPPPASSSLEADGDLAAAAAVLSAVATRYALASSRTSTSWSGVSMTVCCAKAIPFMHVPPRPKTEGRRAVLRLALGILSDIAVAFIESASVPAALQRQRDAAFFARSTEPSPGFLLLLRASADLVRPLGEVVRRRLFVSLALVVDPAVSLRADVSGAACGATGRCTLKLTASRSTCSDSEVSGAPELTVAMSSWHVEHRSVIATVTMLSCSDGRVKTLSMQDAFFMQDAQLCVRYFFSPLAAVFAPTGLS